MKKSILITIMICLLIIMTGCGNKSGLTNTDTENDSANISDTKNNFVSLKSEITELESGFSAVRYDGGYGFDLFLEQGGASSDQDVLRFLTDTMLHESTGLQIDCDVFGCSTISVKNTDGGYLFGRNFDWQNCGALVVAAYPEEGYASVSTVNLDFIKQGAGMLSGFLTDKMLTTAAIYAPLDGMNEKGLCVSVNMIQDNATIQQNTDKPDITTTTAIRLMLDKAATVEEALALLEQYDLHASMNYMIHFAIADSEGNSAAVEYINDEMNVIETPILTNFYLSEGEKQGVGTQQSHTRFDILAETLKDNPSMTALGVRDALDSVSKDNFGEFESTEWSIVFDQAALTATYYHRENYETGYSFKLKEPEINSTSDSMPDDNTASDKFTENTVQQTDTQSEPTVTKEESDMLKLEIIANGKTFSATLYDNEAAKALAGMLPLTLDMSELNGNEKYYYLDTSLPVNSSRPSGIRTGDIMLYGDSCLVLFYKDFSTSYSYTPLGSIDNPDGFAEALGRGGVQVTFRKG